MVDLSTPLDPIHEICGRALGRRVAFQSRSGRTIAGVDAALRGDWIDDITLSGLRGLMPEAAVLAWSRFDPAVESTPDGCRLGEEAGSSRDCSWKRMKVATGWWDTCCPGSVRKPSSRHGPRCWCHAAPGDRPHVPAGRGF